MKTQDTEPVFTTEDVVGLNDDMVMITEYVKQGVEHGTMVEALYWSLRAALSGEARTIADALSAGAREWYK